MFFLVDLGIVLMPPAVNDGWTEGVGQGDVEVQIISNAGETGTICSFISLPPTLAEEVIFSIASVCVSVCLRSAGLTNGPTDLKFCTPIKDHHISDDLRDQGHRSKVKVTKVKNVKILVFSLV